VSVVHGGALGLGTALQAGRSRGGFPTGSSKFFRPHNVSGVDSWQKWVPGLCPEDQSWPVRRADSLATIMCRLSRHSGSLNLLGP